MRAAAVATLFAALSLGACATGSSTQAPSTTKAAKPPNAAAQAASLEAKRGLRTLVVGYAQSCGEALGSLQARTAAAVATTCAGLELAEDPFRPEGAASTAREIERNIERLARGGPGADAAAAALQAAPSSLAFAVSRVILSPPQAARRAGGVLERALRVTLPRAAAGDAMAAATVAGEVAASRAALDLLLPLAGLVAPEAAARLREANAALPEAPPSRTGDWPGYARAVSAEAAAAGVLARTLAGFAQGGAYV